MADDPETTDAPSDEAVEQVADAAPAEGSESTPAPEEHLTPKERRQRRRAAAVAKRGARRAATPEERAAARRRKAAQRRAYRQNLKTRRAEQPKVTEESVPDAPRRPRRAPTPAARAPPPRRKAAQRRAYRERLKTRRAEQPRTEQPVVETAEKTGHQKVRQGIVVSDKADKTIVVRIDVARRHRRYQKTIRSSSKLHAHDERNDAHVGDTVRVVEARPLSRTKRWRLVEVVERAR